MSTKGTKQPSEKDGKEGKEGKQGFSKYVGRMRTVSMKTVMRKSSSIKSVSGSTSKDKASVSEPTKSALPEDAVPPNTTASEVATSATAITPAQDAATTSAQQSTVFNHWGAIQEEKARALFAKYGLTLEPGEWRTTTDTAVQRVVKPIRMRVRRTCHRCQTTFGPDKLCTNCQHVRCTKCPRYPPAKTQENTETALQTILTGKGKEPVGRQPKPKPKAAPLTIPSRTGGQDLIHKTVKQRVRRFCHRCNTTFDPDATECHNCNHTRCKKCPRDPPKLDKYPDGYPGDAEPPKEPPVRTWRKPRQRVRYTCHACLTMFQLKEPICSNCGQERGPQTLRDPPKKHKPEPDPEIVRRVEERLAEVTISSI
ncbi:hypothetical protein BDV25DRAFT_161691 [Aspergillus avenaceus]|uniref:Uncharacterized protein n=1 Tax=Aspergillus avenaceus TaxID=36643 RepID=A0A5N6TKC1_ASPAV|nr:hypothetical protein BDV25DRAFT_161691 [Aspergillus avenaceus]